MTIAKPVLILIFCSLALGGCAVYAPYPAYPSYPGPVVVAPAPAYGWGGWGGRGWGGQGWGGRGWGHHHYR